MKIATFSFSYPIEEVIIYNFFMVRHNCEISDSWNIRQIKSAHLGRFDRNKERAIAAVRKKKGLR